MEEKPLRTTMKIQFKDGSFMLIPRATHADIIDAEDRFGDEIEDFKTIPEKEER